MWKMLMMAGILLVAIGGGLVGYGIGKKTSGDISFEVSVYDGETMLVHRNFYETPKVGVSDSNVDMGGFRMVLKRTK